MRVLIRRVVGVLVAVTVASLGGCGAGLIAGVTTSNGSGSGSPEAQIPQLNIANAVLPLVPAPGDVRTVILADAQLVGEGLEVRIDRADGEPGSAVQLNATAQVQGGSTVISFELDLSPISQTIADPSSSDIAASLSVLANGVSAAESIPILLARQPVALLLLPPGQVQAVVSPVGQRLMIQVDGLLSTETSGIEVLVTTRDPEGADPGAMVTRLASDIAFESVSSGLPTLSASIPGSSFPDSVTLLVRDAIAGESTPITNAYYRPDVALALPGQGPTTGGSLLTLIGSALVPYDFSTSPAQYDFDKVTLTFSKGGRVIELPREDFRVAESASDRLVFIIPPSPDGRPGELDIILKVQLENVDAIVTAKLFLFANPDPYYGPRGAVLDQPPVAAAPIALDNAPSTESAPDFAILTEQGGVGFLQLLLAQQNGMFQPFAAPRQIGDDEVADERLPRDLLVGDFDGDGIPDLFVVNEGSSIQSTHHVVLGQSRPDPPLGEVFKLTAQPGSTSGRVAHFDGDDLLDILLVPGPNAIGDPRPQVFLSRPVAIGVPLFEYAGDVDLGGFQYDAVEVADFNDDGILDIAATSGGELKLSVALGNDDGSGNGDGTFTNSTSIAFVVPGYVPDDNSRAIGLHACQDTPRQSLAIVLSGLEGSLATRPTVAVLKQQPVGGPSLYNFTDPELGGVYVAPVEPIGLSLAANLDAPEPPAAPGPIELVVAMKGEPTIVSIGLLQFNGDAFAPLFGAIENGTAGGTEVPVQVSSMTFDTAFPATQLSGQAKAVFIVHEVDVDGARERRLSTRLVTVPQLNEPRLLPPDAGASLSLEIEGVVGGNFSDISVAAEGAVRDLAVASSQGQGGGAEVTVIVNDGFGGFPGLGRSLDYPNLLPKSLSLISAPIGELDSLVFAASDSRVGIWQHQPTGPPLQVADFETTPLRLLTGDPVLAMTDLDNATQIKVADIDSDGIEDLVVLMSFDVAQPGEGDSFLALLRGKSTPAVGEFPFFVPTELCSVHGNASSFAFGDFATGAALELAVTVPVGTDPTSVDGNHILFYRYEQGTGPADARFVRSAQPNGPQVLLAGSEPKLVVAADLDRDGLDDILVACQGDRSLRLLRNTTAPGGVSNEVDISAFTEALASPNELAAGVPAAMRLSDVNGDGNLDVVVLTQFVAQSGTISNAIATYLSSGTGQFSDARFASSTRIGTFDADLSVDIGDWNRDGVPDLFLGWSVQGLAVNLRVLFGGTR